MATNDGEIIIELQLQQDDFEKRLNAIEHKTQSFGSSIKRTIAALGLGKLAKDFASAGISFNASIEQYQTSFEVMTGSAEKATQITQQLKQIAANTPFELPQLADTTQLLMNYGFTADDAMEKMQMLGDISQGSADKMTRIATAYGQMSSAGKVSLEDVKQMIEAGFNPLQEISKSTGESMASLYDRISDGSLSVDEITASMERSTSAGGKYFQSMDKQSQTLNGKISTLKDTFNEFAGKAMQGLSDVLSNTVIPALTGVLSHSDEIMAVLNALLPVIVAVGSAFASWKIVNFIQDIPKMIGSVKTAILGVNAALAANPVGAVVAAISALVAVFLYLWNTSEEFRQFWTDMWNGIVEWFSGIIESIVNFFTVTIPEAWESFKTNLQELCDSIVQWFQDAWNSVIAFFTETIPAWIQSVIDWFNQLPYNIGYMVGQIIGHFIQWGIDLKNFVTEDIPAFINSVVEWFKSLPGKIWEWLKSAWEKVKTWGSNIYTSARDWVSKTIDSVVDWFRSLPGKIWTWLTNAVSKVRDWGSNLWNTGINAAKQLVDSVVQKAKELPGKMVDIGINLIKGLWEGIGSVKDWILDKISGFCDGIVDGMLDFFNIGSPSKLMRDMIGKWLPPGIAVGFELAAPKASKDMTKEAGKMVKDIQGQYDASIGGFTLENQLNVAKQATITNAFPKTMQLVRNGVNEFRFVLDNGAEVAHWLAPEMGVELAELR
ncbi:tape measure protein [[Clostridium] innocuum]|jgi:tape measure domain-containing protein|uniref:tape measure protein n=1 Tax=Clostridium innocuum TaxID=1522 RepID=UPI001E5A78D8|nr:tape measure protein [[Clostridium] innocuum]MCC2836538.1 tape measure protein [[Clostridium] innocuum]MCG4661061.1 tape measure protein [[Clostridium] innocuum]